MFIDPGFPVQKQQLKVLGQKFESFDVYNFRGESLYDKLEAYLKKGNVAGIIYSNPNNPSWICLSERELQIIAEVADKYNVVVIEDLAYFGMDFREDYANPGNPPYQPTVAHYTDNYILLISSSKIFSYAGQRIAVMVVSENYSIPNQKDLKVYTSLNLDIHLYLEPYILSVQELPIQHNMPSELMLKAANDGTYHYRDEVIEYSQKAKIMKRKLFMDNGFKLVYDKDEDEPIADGFYFTISYPGIKGEELLEKLLYYGVSAISLAITGSEEQKG